jgi:signal transduction histidine kinase
VLTTALNVILLFSGIVLIETILLRALLSILFIEVVAFLLVGHMIASLVSVQREQRQRLTEANIRLAQHASTLEQLTVSRERNRLARELHDTLAHSLSGVAVQLEALDTLLEDGSSEVKALLRQTLSTTRSGLNETRRALRAGPLDDPGLALALRNLAESVASRGSLKLSLDIQDPLENLSPELEQGIYRVAQEALENVTRHAQASDLQVHLSQSTDCLELTISDNGRGFDLSDVNLSDQFGIRGMRERTEMLAGQLEMESQLMICVLICDDQYVVLEGLQTILRSTSEIEVVGVVAHDGAEALAAIPQTHPDVVLMDLKMPGMNGIQATRLIGDQFPSVRVLALTTYDADEWVFDAIRSGAASYL